MKPFLREGDWDSAVSVALEEINGRLRRSLLSEESGEDEESINANAYLSLFSDGWNEMKRRASQNWHDWGGGGNGGGGGSGGGGGGGLFGDWNLGRLFESNWAEVSPVSALLALSLLWGGAKVRSSTQRRRFEAKLARIAPERYVHATVAHLIKRQKVPRSPAVRARSLLDASWFYCRNALPCLPQLNALPAEKSRREGPRVVGGTTLDIID